MGNHIIYKQIATIEIANQQQASKIHEEISDVLKYELPALLEPLFDELAGDDRIIRLDALSIDLKEITQPNFKYKFKEKLFREIEKALVETTQTAGYDNNVTVIPKQQSGLDAFIYFLQHGLKPWYVSAKTMKAWAAELLIQFTDTHWQQLAAWIKTHYDPLVTERLAQQCPEEILYRLIKELSGLNREEWKTVFDDLLVLYNLFTGKPKEINRAVVWQDSFTAFIKSMPSAEALYSIVKEAYQQRQIKTDITRPVEIQQIRALLHSEIVLQTTLQFAADVKKESVIDHKSETYRDETKDDAVIKDDVVINDNNVDLDAPAEKNKERQTLQKGSDENDSLEKTVNTVEKDKAEDVFEDNAEDNIITKNNDVNIGKPDLLNEKNQDEITDKSTNETTADLKDVNNHEEKKSLVKKQEQKKKRPPAVAENEAQYVNNCGVIILHPFLQKYLVELGLVKEKAFVSIEACKRAVSLLHFLASGETEIDEFNLLLQKLLCNLPLEETLPAKFDISDKEKEESEDLLRSVIDYWPPLKNTSIAGLRNTFLQREGKLEKKETGWKLRVEQKTVDILLDKLPWGFSTIRLPWMADTISVEWC